MKNTVVTLRALILVMALVVAVALPAAVSASGPSKKADTGYWTNSYGLSVEELGAGATPLAGKMSIAEYRASQAIEQNSVVSLDSNLVPIKPSPFLFSMANK